MMLVLLMTTIILIRLRSVRPSEVTKSSASFGWGKGRKVTAAGWQVTLCDPTSHVTSHSGEAISITNCDIRVYFTLLIVIRFGTKTG